MAFEYHEPDYYRAKCLSGRPRYQVVVFHRLESNFQS